MFKKLIGGGGKSKHQSGSSSPKKSSGNSSKQAEAVNGLPEPIKDIYKTERQAEKEMETAPKKIGSFGASTPSRAGMNSEGLLENFQSASQRKRTKGDEVPGTPQPSSASGRPFEQLYTLGDVLGSGAFSTVRTGVHKHHPTETFAVKCVQRSKLSEEDAAALLDEVSILKELRHKHIIRLYDFFHDPQHYYLVMEQMNGGELFDRIVAKAYYNEKEARDTCKIVLEAVNHIHANGIAHRDLKPENLLLVHADQDSEVKIADFGFAKKCQKPRSLTTQCGTPGYVAPEILEGVAYDTKADMWSVGVILYILLGGYPPFLESNQKELFRKIKAGEYEFHDEYWGPVSQDAKDLISSLLVVNPSKRLTADVALENTWILGDSATLESKDLTKQHQEFIKFNAKRKFRSAIYADMAMHKLSSFLEECTKEAKEAEAAAEE